jgi:multidrug efflux pump subunit AcrA (membrane-fusion protein)
LGESDEAPRARVTFEDDGTVVQWDGLLRRFEPVDPQTQTVKAVVEVRGRSQDDLALAANVFCRVTISTRPVPTTTAIPLAALQERNRVFLLREGVLDVVEVEIGRRLGSWVEIRAGLSAGDLVITSTLEKPIEGTPLTRVEAAE